MIRVYVSAMLTVVSSCVAAQIVAVPPASNPEQATPKAAAAMLLPSGTPARQIALGPLTPTEDAQTKAAAARRSEKPGVPLQIGIARSVGADDSVIRLPPDSRLRQLHPPHDGRR